jgi:hypothetical protein
MTGYLIALYHVQRFFVIKVNERLITFGEMR